MTIFPGEPGLAGCPLNSPSLFVPGLWGNGGKSDGEKSNTHRSTQSVQCNKTDEP